MSQKTQKIVTKIIANHKPEYNKVPTKNILYKWIDQLLSLLFPIEIQNENDLVNLMKKNQDLFYKIIIKTGKYKEELQYLTNFFYDNLDIIIDDLYLDANEILDKDPAASCISEILHIYPGFYAISIYRISNFLSEECNIPFIPRMLSEYAHSKTGIDINPKAEIGSPFCIDHGTGVVIGETCKIGKHVSLYQGVTLGALQVDKILKGKKRHPTIEDNVIIYSNSTILGGSTIIGNNSIIGGNVFLTKSVEPHSLLFNRTKTITKKIESNKTL